VGCAVTEEARREEGKGRKHTTKVTHWDDSTARGNLLDDLRL
jgi:hypothetical protein